MEHKQILYFFGITMFGNIIANTFTQNNLFYLIILFSFLIGSFGVGIIVENKYNISKKIENFNLQKINCVLNETPSNMVTKINSVDDSDSKGDD